MNRMISAFCVLSVALCILSSCRSRYKSMQYVGKHRVEISEGTPNGTTRMQKFPDGKLVFTHESDETSVRLEDEVLTVNGKRYVLAHKDDSIKITDGHVEINGQPAKPGA